MKKILIVSIVLMCILATGAWFGKDQIKSLVEKNPQVYKIAQKISSKYRALQFQYSSLGDLDKNESMTEASFFIDFDNELGSFEKFWQGLGQDSFKDGFLKSHNEAYYKLIGGINQDRQLFKYVHSKGMFSDTYHEKRKENTGGHIYTVENGEVKYNWEIMDEIFDLILECRMKPLVSFTYMPSALASNLKKKNPWHHGLVSPPNDYQEWQKLIFNTVKHLEERYGNEEIEKWYYEVWNEPDLPRFFWVYHPNKKKFANRGDNREYFKLYDYSVAGAIEANEKIKIGGPAIAGDIEMFLNPWMDHIKSGTNLANARGGVRVDFLSRHNYGDLESKILPSMKAFIDNAKKHNGELVENSQFLITEYGPTASPKAWLNTRYVAAWLVKLVDGIFYLGDREGSDYVPDMMFFWTKPIPPNFSDHFGIVTAFGHPKHPSPNSIVKRPVFNAFDALSRLGSVRIEVKGTEFGDPIHAIAAKSGSNAVQVLIYHLDEGDKKNKNNKFFPVSISINNLPFSNFESNLYLIDKSHSNGYSVWQELGSPKRPNKNQLEQLQQRDDLELVESEVVKIEAKKTYVKEVNLQNNSVALLILKAGNGKQ